MPYNRHMTLHPSLRTVVSTAILVVVIAAQAHAQKPPPLTPRFAVDLTGGNAMFALPAGTSSLSVAVGGALALDEDLSLRTQIEAGVVPIVSVGVSHRSIHPRVGRSAREVGIAAVHSESGWRNAIYAGGTIDSYLRGRNGAVTFKARAYLGSHSLGVSLTAGYKWRSDEGSGGGRDVPDVRADRRHYSAIDR